MAMRVTVAIQKLLKLQNRAITTSGKPLVSTEMNSRHSRQSYLILITNAFTYWEQMEIKIPILCTTVKRLRLWRQCLKKRLFSRVYISKISYILLEDMMHTTSASYAHVSTIMSNKINGIILNLQILKEKLNISSTRLDLKHQLVFLMRKQYSFLEAITKRMELWT